MSDRGDQVDGNLEAVKCIHAFVQSGATEIAYSRSGRGPPVLLIGADTDLLDCLRLSLVSHFLVIVPQLDAHRYGMASADWLLELIDGLGLIRPHCVADGSQSAAALHFALSHPQRLDRLVIAWNDDVDSSRCDDILTDRIRSADRPLMLLRFVAVGGLGEPAPEHLAALAAFLLGDSGTDSGGDSGGNYAGD